MKKIAVAVIAMLALIAHAGEKAQPRVDVLRGQAFGCAGFVKPEVVQTLRDNTQVACVTLDSVHSTLSGAVVIPKKSRLLGWKKGRTVEWTSWTTPDHVVVGDSALHGTGFVSEIDPLNDVFTVVAVRNIMVPRDARH